MILDYFNTNYEMTINYKKLTVFNSELPKSRHSYNISGEVRSKSWISVISIVPGCSVQSVHQGCLGVQVEVFTAANLYFGIKKEK